jgi:hypothetical protein
MNQHLINKRIRIIDLFISELEKASTIRLIVNGKELLHDFDQMDCHGIKEAAIEVCNSHKKDYRRLETDDE